MTPLARLLAVLCAGLALAARAPAAELTVAAAASLTDAFKQIAPMFEAAAPGTTVRLTFGASGALLQQIAHGAPVDVFASADQETMDRAQAHDMVRPDERHTFATNTLVVVVPKDKAASPQALVELMQPAYARIAIGTPASVPVGRYAQAVLEKAGLWTALRPKVIGAQNVRQVLDYVARGEVDAGFVYATDAALMPGKVKTAFTVPTATPIAYPIAPVAASPNAALARRFIDFVRAPAAQAVLARHGFGKP